MTKRNSEVVHEVDELRPHYNFDYTKAKPNRFAKRFDQEAVVVVLDSDVAAVFQTSEAVNEALRVLITALGNLAETSNVLDKVQGGVTIVSSQT